MVAERLWLEMKRNSRNIWSLTRELLITTTGSPQISEPVLLGFFSAYITGSYTQVTEPVPSQLSELVSSRLFKPV